MTTIRSARAAVVSRCATTIVVRAAVSSLMAWLTADFGGQVEGGGRLVEQQDGRVGQLCAGQRDQLPLAGRQVAAAFGHHVVVARPAAAMIMSCAPVARAAASISVSVASGRA